MKKPKDGFPGVQTYTMKQCMVHIAFSEVVAGMMKQEDVWQLTADIAILHHLKLTTLDFAHLETLQRTKRQ